jgi:alpha-beta hydrolase superfamily lysophospholipase
MQRVARGLGLGLFALALVAILMWSFQRRMAYPGAYMDRGNLLPRPAGVESWTRDLDDGSVEAWFMPGDGVSPKQPGPAVVFLHGNGELIDDWPDALRGYTRAGVSVLLPEYRGYGRSAGTPSEVDITIDLQHWVDRLAEREEVDADRLVYHGRSLGGGFATRLLGYRTPAALILSSTFTSLPDVAHDLLKVPRFLVRDKLPIAETIRSFEGPVLVLHGADDRVVPVEHARTNAATAPAGRLIVYRGAGHNNLATDPRVWRDIDQFLRDTGVLDPID